MSFSATVSSSPDPERGQILQQVAQKLDQIPQQMAQPFTTQVPQQVIQKLEQWMR